MNKRCLERHPGSTKQGRGRFSKGSSWCTIFSDTLYSREYNPCHQDRRQKTREADEVNCSLGKRLKGFVGMRVASLAYVYPYSRSAEAQHGYTRHLSRPREAPLDVSPSKPPKSGQKNSNFCQILLQKKSNSDKDDHVWHVLSHS